MARINVIQVISLPLPSEYAASATFLTKLGFASVPPEAFLKRSPHVDPIDAAGTGGDVRSEDIAAENILSEAIQDGLRRYSTKQPPLPIASR